MTCQWLYGEPTNRKFCGMPGNPWCSVHRKKVYRPPVEVNLYGISASRQAVPIRRGGSKLRTDSIAEKIRQAIKDSPDTPATKLAEQLGCSAHHVRKIRRQMIGFARDRNKAADIRKELSEGLNPQQIAQKLDCNDAYVRAVRQRMKGIIQ